MDSHLREFWEVRDRLSDLNGIILLNSRIVIPRSLRNNILHSLHAAHQGATAMSARANQTVYWPGMNAAIRNHRSTCTNCNQIAPRQPSEPLILTPKPELPFQKICADFFEHDGHSYLTVLDRFSYWINVYHLPNTATTGSLLKHLRNLFTAYGVPEEIASDGGPQFTSGDCKSFLNSWGIHHRLSSAEYPQSNGRAELAVKTVKRTIIDNTIRGSLDTDEAARAILQYRNTPIQSLGLSPAQILFHRQLRDHIPNHPNNLRLHKKWLIAAKKRENPTNLSQETPYQRTDSTPQNLPPIPVGTRVILQDQRSRNNFRKWNCTGVLSRPCPFANTKSIWMAQES